MLRWLLLAALAPLAGCIDGEAASALAPADPDRLLIRFFIDDLDDDGQQELHVRLAAVAGTQVKPFAGRLEVLMAPEDDTHVLPRVWRIAVQEADFTDTALPYYEIVTDATGLTPGDTIEVRAEARLAGGHLLEGIYAASV